MDENTELEKSEEYIDYLEKQLEELSLLYNELLEKYQILKNEKTGRNW